MDPTRKTERDELPRCASATRAAVMSGRGGEAWGQFAWNVARDQRKLTGRVHHYLATHPNAHVRQTWAERDDTPAELRRAVLATERDQDVRHALLARTSDGRSVEWVLASEGRLSLLARALNPELSDEEAAAHLAAALPEKATRTSRIVLRRATLSASSWQGRPQALKVLLTRAEEVWDLEHLAPLCRDEELGLLVLTRALEVGGSTRVALETAGRCPLTPGLRGAIAAHRDHPEPEVAERAEVTADPLGVARAVTEAETRLRNGTRRHQHLIEVLGKLTDPLLLEECVEVLTQRRVEIGAGTALLVGRSVLANPDVNTRTATLAAGMLDAQRVELLDDRYWKLTAPARGAVRARALELGTRERSRRRRVTPARRLLAHSLCDPVALGMFNAPAGLLATHLEPWLGTPAEETLAALLSNWDGTLGELLAAVPVVSGAEELTSLPAPVRRRAHDEPPF